MTIARDAFFHRLAAAGKIGFGEAYMAGDWAADDLAEALGGVRRPASTGCCRSRSSACAACTSRASRPSSATRPPGAARNISRHYDLSNDLFALVPRPHDDLLRRRVRAGRHARGGPDAQVRDALPHGRPAARPTICSRSAPAGAGSRCTPPRTRGCRVTTATISAEQAALARERVAAAGLSDRVEVDPARLPRDRGPLLEDRLDRDARGGRRGVLARVLRDLRPAAEAGRRDGPADDHDAAPPLPGVTRTPTAGSTSTSSRAG